MEEKMFARERRNFSDVGSTIWFRFESYIFIYIFCKSYSELRTHNSWRLAFGQFVVLLLAIQYFIPIFHSVCDDLCIIL